MSKLFLTGSTGFLGKHIFERWKGDVYLHSRNQGFDCLLEYEPDYIIHSAAEIYETEEMFESNVVLTQQLLESARKLTNLKGMIVIGSSSEYGRKKKPMKETDFLDPTTIYEATKGMASLLSQAYARTYGLPIMIVRPFSVYGIYESIKRLIPLAIRNVKSGREMKVAPGYHDFIHIDDLLDAFYLLLDDPQPGEIFNVGTGYQLSNEDVVETIEKIFGKKIKRVLVGKMHPYDSNNWVCDYSKMKRLGWEPKFTFYKGIKNVTS